MDTLDFDNVTSDLNDDNSKTNYYELFLIIGLIVLIIYGIYTYSNYSNCYNYYMYSNSSKPQPIPVG